MACNWNPVEKPFRLCIVRPLAGGNWRDEITTYATQAEAETVFNGTIKGRFSRAMVHKAENAETWTRNGYWRLVCSRKPRVARA